MVALGWQKFRSLGAKNGKHNISGLRANISPEDAKYGTQIININVRKNQHGERGRIFIHPDYKGHVLDPVTKVNTANDIGIIVFNTEIEFPENADSGSYWDDHSPDQS